VALKADHKVDHRVVTWVILKTLVDHNSRKVAHNSRKVAQWDHKVVLSADLKVHKAVLNAVLVD
jgi:hypothetical protein